MSVLKKYNSITSQWDSIVVGSSGPQGAQGAQGGNGAQGAQGPQGAPGATVVTSTTRPSSPTTGQLIFETDTLRLAAYNGSGWITQNGLGRVGGGTLSSTTTSFANVFSSRYDSYMIILSNVSSSTANQWVSLTMTGASSGYYGGFAGTYWNGGTANANYANSSAWQYIGQADSGKTYGCNIIVTNPFLSKETMASWQSLIAGTGGYHLYGGGWLNNTTSYTGFTLTSVSGNFAGTVNVYGLSLV